MDKKVTDLANVIVEVYILPTIILQLVWTPLPPQLQTDSHVWISEKLRKASVRGKLKDWELFYCLTPCYCA